MLGRPFSLAGEVIKGAGRGSKLGLHTANLRPENILIPGHGVYLTRTRIEGAKDEVWPSVTSIGTNPTFHEDHLSIETHLLDYEGKLLGKKITIEFLVKMRDQIAYSSPAELVEQMKHDIEKARREHACYQGI